MSSMHIASDVTQNRVSLTLSNTASMPRQLTVDCVRATQHNTLNHTGAVLQTPSLFSLPHKSLAVMYEGADTMP